MPSQNPILNHSDVRAIAKLEEVASELLSIDVPDNEKGTETSVLVVRKNVLATARWTNDGHVEIEISHK